MIIFEFQSHLGIMIGTLVLTICGLVLIVVHASGTWLTTTVSNNYYPSIYKHVLKLAILFSCSPLTVLIKCLE